MIDLGRSQNFDDKPNDSDDDNFEKVNTKSIFPSSKEIAQTRQQIGATIIPAKRNIGAENAKTKAKSERDLREEKENSFRTNVERPADIEKQNPKNSKAQSSASKLKAQLLFANVTVVSPPNKQKGNIGNKNASLSTKNDHNKSVRQSTSGALKFRDNYVEAKPIRNTSVKLRDKSPDEPEIMRVFVNKSLNLRSSSDLKENYKLTLVDYKSSHSRTDKGGDTQQKVSLREAILNRTRSEKSLIKKKAQEHEEKVVLKIFRTLDKYKRGVISAETVDISTIDSKVLELISEVLFILEDEGCKMNVEQFHQRLVEQNLMENLIKLFPSPLETDQVKNCFSAGFL